MTYNAGEKILHPCISGKNSFTRGLRLITPPPHSPLKVKWPRYKSATCICRSDWFIRFKRGYIIGQMLQLRWFWFDSPDLIESP